MVSFCSKSYAASDGQQVKFSCKGIQKNVLKTFETMQNVFDESKSISLTYIRFKPRQNTIQTSDKKSKGLHIIIVGDRF